MDVMWWVIKICVVVELLSDRFNEFNCSTISRFYTNTDQMDDVDDGAASIREIRTTSPKERAKELPDQ